MIHQILAAVLSHLWFKSHEPHFWTAAWSLSVLPLASPIIEAYLSRSQAGPIAANLLSNIKDIALGYITFYSALAASILIYRLSPIHPLAKYPGPLICRSTKLWGVWVAIRGDYHKYTQKLHQQYGPVVRVGPNELSILDKDVITPVLGNQGMPKGPMWDGRRFGEVGLGKPYNTIIDVRDKDIHHELRKAWNTAFSSGPIKDYNDLLDLRVKQLRDQLNDATEKGKPVDLSKWFSFFSFDFMGDLAFGGCFELMRNGDDNGFWKVMEEALDIPAIIQHIPWIRPLFFHLPYISAKMEVFPKFGIKQALNRRGMVTKKKDLFYHLYESQTEDSGQPVKYQMDLVVSNSLLTIIAGSDTTATTLAALICYLISDRRVWNTLQAELDEAFPSNSLVDGWPDIEIEKLIKLPYINAVVNEVLRLVPALPTSVQRSPAPGSGGKMLGDTKIFIPEGVSVNIPPYSMHRDPRYFSPSPESFIPERWLQSSENKYVTNRDAYIPFSFGPANCAGRAMALNELRYVGATLVRGFDIHHLSMKGASAQVLEKKATDWVNELKDRFVFNQVDLPVEMTPRNL